MANFSRAHSYCTTNTHRALSGTSLFSHKELTTKAVIMMIHCCATTIVCSFVCFVKVKVLIKGQRLTVDVVARFLVIGDVDHRRQRHHWGRVLGGLLLSFISSAASCRLLVFGVFTAVAAAGAAVKLRRYGAGAVGEVLTLTAHAEAVAGVPGDDADVRGVGGASAGGGDTAAGDCGGACALHCNRSTSSSTRRTTADVQIGELAAVVRRGAQLGDQARSPGSAGGQTDHWCGARRGAGDLWSSGRPDEVSDVTEEVTFDEKKEFADCKLSSRK